VDAEDSSTLFNGRNLETFIGLESCTASIIEMLYLLQRALVPELGAQGPCGH
jgi:hypothetical protein